MKALMKLSGVKASVHGPVVDAAGFGERGWGEVTRADNERRMFDAIEKAHLLDSSGKIPVVLHATNGTPGKEYLPDKTKEEGFRANKIYVINQETGQLANPVEEEYKFYPEHPEMLKGKNGEKAKGIYHSAESQVASINNAEWENKLTDLATFNKHADEVIGAAPMVLGEYQNAIVDDKTGKTYNINRETGKKIEELPTVFGEGKREYYKKMRDADIFLENVQLNFRYDLENIIDDFVLICFLVGNDFLPHLPGFDIRIGGIDILMEFYKKKISTTVYVKSSKKNSPMASGERRRRIIRHRR
jgi:hypothetical protein